MKHLVKKYGVLYGPLIVLMKNGGPLHHLSCPSLVQTLCTVADVIDRPICRSLTLQSHLFQLLLL